MMDAEAEGRKLAEQLGVSPADIRRMTLDAGQSMLKQFPRLPPSPLKDQLIDLSQQLCKLWEEADEATLFAWLAIAWAERH